MGSPQGPPNNISHSEGKLVRTLLLLAILSFKNKNQKSSSEPNWRRSRTSSGLQPTDDKLQHFFVRVGVTSNSALRLGLFFSMQPFHSEPKSKAPFLGAIASPDRHCFTNPGRGYVVRETGRRAPSNSAEHSRRVGRPPGTASAGEPPATKPPSRRRAKSSRRDGTHLRHPLTQGTATMQILQATRAQVLLSQWSERQVLTELTLVQRSGGAQ